MPHIILGEINIQPLLDAAKTFDEALDQVDSTLTRDGAIQRFEYTFELTWKTLKRILKHRGIDVNSPRETLRQAAQEGLLQDIERWFDFLNYRNSATHTYNDVIADEIFDNLSDFQKVLHTLLAKVKLL